MTLWLDSGEDYKEVFGVAFIGESLKGADVNAEDGSGQTALMKMRNRNVARMLRKAATR